MKKLLSLGIFLFIHLVLFAQTRQLTGVVKDSKGNPLPGATVQVKGKPVRTSSANNGAFKLTVPSDGFSLEVSYVGYAVRTITITPGDNNITVSLEEESNIGSEVIVTAALGIQRKAKSLSYSTEQVKGTDLTVVPETNFVNSLQGKVSGLNVFRGSGGAGSSANVVLRGNKSFFGNNQPLYVIDGVPYANNSPTQPAGIYNGAALPDAGDNLSQINPDDIESVTVLKGASAAALYGSQAANGVVLITTKKGRAGTVSIDYNSSYSIDKEAYSPDLQFSYGQTGPGNNKSWSYTKGSFTDNTKDFFQTGKNWTNGVSLRGGNETFSSFFSYSNTHASNIYPNSNYNKNTFNFSQSAKFFNDKLTATATALYTQQDYLNPLSPGLYNNPLTGLYLFPRGLDFNDYKNNYELFDSSKNYPLQNWWNIKLGSGGDDNQQNPFWIMNRDLFQQKTNKVYSSLVLKYQFTDWLSLQLRGNIDKEYRNLQSKLYSGTQTVIASPLGNYKLFNYDNQNVYSDAILSFSKKVKDLGITAFAGTSINSTNNYFQHFEGPLAYANIFQIRNIVYDNLFIEESQYRKRLQAVFGNLNLSYKDYLFLDVTARNDWSSALAFTDTKSYFYPSVGLSGVISEMAHLPKVINYWKVRGSYAIVGNDFPPYYTSEYSGFSGSRNNVNAASIGPKPGTVLLPEKSKGFEIGTEMRLKNDLFFFDFTYFKNNTYNQVITVSAPLASNLSNYYVNAGNIQNTGIELSVGSSPIKTPKLKWDIYGTLYINKNVVKEYNGNDNIVHGLPGADNSNMTYFGIKKGLPYSTFFGKKFVRDDEGYILLDTTSGASYGKPLYTQTGTDSTGLGSAIPKALIGLRNTFTIGKFSLTFLVDARLGGVAMDVTQAIIDEYGTSKATANARDAGSSFMPGKVRFIGGGKVTSVDPLTWYSTVGSRAGVAEYYITSATNVRLRELALTYSLPGTLLGKTKVVRGITLGLNARNLFFFYKKAPFDPDIAVGTQNGNQGYNAFTAPATRSFGGTIKVSF